MVGTHFAGVFATNPFHLRVADRIIQQLLRHKDIATTMNVYVKAVGADGREAVLKLDREFQAVKVSPGT
jgi:hypothetical protein